jgi:V/A-type H+-transporting ATPase subunit E
VAGSSKGEGIMADELQALLNRITEEGLKKAEAERLAMVEKASVEANRIIAAATTTAAKLVEEGRREAALLCEKGEQSLRQAARDVLLSLRSELQKRLAEVAKSTAGNALDAPAMAAILADLARHFAASGGREQRLEVLLNPAQVEALRRALGEALAADLRARVDLSPVPSVKAGFRLRLSGSDVVYDFSDEALAAAISGFLGPKLVAIVAGDAA